MNSVDHVAIEIDWDGDIHEKQDFDENVNHINEDVDIKVSANDARQSQEADQQMEGQVQMTGKP